MLHHLAFTWCDFWYVGSLRLGGEPRTSDDHVVLIGDAAGMIDPMTGDWLFTTIMRLCFCCGLFVCLSVCLVCKQGYSKSYGWISLKFLDMVSFWIEKHSASFEAISIFSLCLILQRCPTHVVELTTVGNPAVEKAIAWNLSVGLLTSACMLSLSRGLHCLSAFSWLYRPTDTLKLPTCPL